MKAVIANSPKYKAPDVASRDKDAPTINVLLGYFLIFTLAVGLRLIHLWSMKDTPLFSFLMGDSEIYDLWATEIASNNWLGNQIFFQAPLYPYFLGVVYALFGKDLMVIRLIQIFLGSLSCLLVAASGKYFFSRKIGMLAGVILAVYPPAIYFDCLIQKAVFALFFMALLLFLLSQIVHHAKWIYWLLSGLVLGCLVLVRENALILVCATLAWLFFHFWNDRKKRMITWGAAFALGVFLILFPVALRNKIVGNEFVLTTSNFGFNLYIGNSSQAVGTYTPLVWGRGDWRYERKDATELAEKALGKTLSPTEVSNYWTRKTIDTILSNPFTWLRLMAKKWLLVWNAVELSDTESLYAHYDWSYLLRGIGSVLHFGIIWPLAVLGICLSWKSRSRVWVLYLFMFSYAAGISLFFVFARFRHPMIAILVLFTSAGIIEGVRLFREKHYRTMLIALSIGILPGVMANWDIISKKDCTANTYYNLGVSLEKQGDLADAVQYYRRALVLNASHTMAHNNLGIALWKQRRFDAAVQHFYKALNINPDMAETHNNLGIALYTAGDLESALHHFREVLRIDPDYDAHADYNIACILARQQRLSSSLEWLRRAIRKGYSNREQLLADPDLDSVRRLPEFKALMESNFPAVSP